MWLPLCPDRLEASSSVLRPPPQPKVPTSLYTPGLWPILSLQVTIPSEDNMFQLRNRSWGPLPRLRQSRTPTDLFYSPEWVTWLLRPWRYRLLFSSCFEVFSLHDTSRSVTTRPLVHSLHPHRGVVGEVTGPLDARSGHRTRDLQASEIRVSRQRWPSPRARKTSVPKGGGHGVRF